MPTASTAAAILLALTALAVVVRWPRPRADRQILERRAQSLEALAAVVTRSASTREHHVAHHLAQHNLAQRDPAEVDRHDAITVLGPVDDPPGSAVRERSGGPDPASRHHPHSPAPRLRNGSTHRHHEPTPTRLVHLGVDDVPPDDDLAETVDGLTGFPIGQTGTHGDAIDRATTDALAPARPVVGSSSNGSSSNASSSDASLSDGPQGDGPPAPARGRHRTSVGAGVDLPKPLVLRRSAAIAASVAVLLAGVLLALVRPGGSPVPPGPADAVEASPAVPAPFTDSTLPPPLPPSGAVGEAVTFDVTAPFTLDLAAGDTTWVRVQTANGIVLFEGTLAPNDTTTVPATGPVQLRVGNPAGLLAAADGRLIDHPRPAGQPVTLALG